MPSNSFIMCMSNMTPDSDFSITSHLMPVASGQVLLGPVIFIREEDFAFGTVFAFASWRR